MQLDENRVWIDGCFDFTHHGHSGAILQARQTIKDSSKGVLFCGVHNDESIAHNKGWPPVMNSQERYEHTRANRWCSYVVEDAPYVTSPEWMDRYGCKYVVHGDDITLDANGEDCYQLMKDLGRFQVVRRTKGVSTTEIIQRILTKTYSRDTCLPSMDELRQYSSGSDGHQPYCFVYRNGLDEQLIKGGYEWDETLANYRFITGDFDLFHMGHIEQLKRLSGDAKRLIVVITTNDRCIMSLKERVLSVLSCKYVDGMVVSVTDAPPSYPVHFQLDDPALNVGTFSYLSKAAIITRIEDHRAAYTERNVKKGMSF